MIVGPAVGGVLIASVGLPLTYVVDVLTYAVSPGCLALIAPYRQPMMPNGRASPLFAKGSSTHEAGRN